MTTLDGPSNVMQMTLIHLNQLEKAMRLILGATMVLALACGTTLAGQAKLDAAKLAGKWEPVPEKVADKDKDKDKKEKAPTGPAMVIEFSPDGKMPTMGAVTMTVSSGGNDLRVEGKYKLMADKLLVEMKVGDKDVKETLTVKKLTDTELVTEDSKQKSETLRRKR